MNDVTISDRTRTSGHFRPDLRNVLREALDLLRIRNSEVSVALVGTSAIRTLGNVAPEDVVVVGDDATTDVAGAKACGCTGVLVRTGKYRPEDERSNPDAVIDSLEGLPVLLGL